MATETPVEVSMLKIYSIAIVSVDKQPNTDLIKAWPTETLSGASGDANAPKMICDASLEDNQSETQLPVSNIRCENTIEATWLPLGNNGNRITAPDVKANETVLLWRYGDTDRYYWTSLYREPCLRRLEEAVYGYSDLRSPDLTAFDASSSYTTTVSTLNKHITIQTAKSDGEPYAYTLKIDTQRGRVTVTDDQSQGWVLDSTTSTFTLNIKNIVFNCVKFTCNTP